MGKKAREEERGSERERKRGRERGRGRGRGRGERQGEDQHDVNAAEFLEGSVECLVDRGGVGDIEVDSQKVVIRGAVKLQLRAVSRRCDHFVALLQRFLDQLVAEAGRRSCNEEDLWRHG